jgi:hypothetical protein
MRSGMRRPRLRMWKFLVFRSALLSTWRHYEHWHDLPPVPQGQKVMGLPQQLHRTSHVLQVSDRVSCLWRLLRRLCFSSAAETETRSTEICCTCCWSDGGYCWSARRDPPWAHWAYLALCTLRIIIQPR